MNLQVTDPKRRPSQPLCPEPGDSLHFIGDQPHHWANETVKPAGALWFALRDS